VGGFFVAYAKIVSAQWETQTASPNQTHMNDFRLNREYWRKGRKRFAGKPRLPDAAKVKVTRFYGQIGSYWFSFFHVVRLR